MITKLKSILGKLILDKGKSLLLLGLLVMSYWLGKYSKKALPQTQKSEVQVKTIKEVMLQTQVVYRDRLVTIKKHNGDVIEIVDKGHSESIKESDRVAKSLEKKMVKVNPQINRDRYSIDVFYNPSLSDWQHPTVDLLNPNIMLGARVSELPLFVTVGSNLKLNNFTLGMRIEL